MRRDGRTVLVVDDDRINRGMLSKLLEHEGYRPTTAADGREALTALSEQRFDAVLLDIVMPEVDGMEVLRTLKRDARLWHIPVIMISAVDETDAIVACLELGADDYVQKPFDPVLLRARLNACLARRQFHDLELAYQKIVEEQAAELEALRHGHGAAGAGREAASGPRRAQVAVLATGLGGVDDVTALADPGGTFEVLEQFHATVKALVGHFEATVSSRAAGAVIIVFDGPLPGPDPATAAVGMAVALGDEMAVQLAERTNRPGATLCWGAGVAVGDATLGPVGGDGALAVAAVGPAAARACELADLARRQGGILLDDAALAAAGHAVTAEPITVPPTAATPLPAHRLVHFTHPHGGDAAPPDAGRTVQGGRARRHGLTE